MNPKITNAINQATGKFWNLNNSTELFLITWVSQTFQCKLKMLRSGEMQINIRTSTFSLVAESIKSVEELVPARRGKQLVI